MQLPAYYIVGTRPVKLVRTEDGGMDVLALNEDTGQFERALSLLSKVLQGAGDVEEVSQAAFDTQVEAVRARRR